MPLSISINGVIISDYLNKYQCKIDEVYDTENSFEAIDGTKQEIYLGDKRTLTVDFEPMSTEQLTELFTAIKSDRDVTIIYTDPIEGENTEKIFTCNSLPTATYFESDPIIDPSNPNRTQILLFWTIPTITFIQKDIDMTGGLVGYYEYQLYIGGALFPPERIDKDLSVTNSVSCNGFSVGQIASSGISGKVKLLSISDIPNNNAEIVLQKRNITVENNEYIYGNWYTLGIYFLRDMKVNNLIMSFSGLDSTCFLDNNYYINYSGNATAQTISQHVNAISEMLADLTNHSEISIPYYCDNVQIQPQEEQNARTFISKVASSGAVNYAQKITRAQNQNDNDTITITDFSFGENVFNLSNSQISDLEIGKIADDIDTIILYCGSITKLPSYIYSTMYQDYNIYVIGNLPSGSFPKAATTLEVQTPYYGISAAQQGGNFQNLLNENFGSEFSVSKAVIDEFIPICSEINFTDQNLNQYTFYATSISYKLTKHGIYASISGKSRNFSDFQYIGGMQRQLENKLSLDSTYNNIYIDTDGVHFAAPKAGN